MNLVAPGTRVVDVLHQDTPHVIAVAVLETQNGLVLIDPGPASTLETLEAALQGAGGSVSDVHTILLTHIHLDHAGATGSILQSAPDARVYVHPIGMPHLVDPSRLLQSAARLFGPAMDQLWGRCRPVPRAAITPIGRSRTLDLDGIRLEVTPTPGHASHHLCFFDASTGIAFVGDAAGARIGDQPLVLPATPPPDIDPGLIRSSLERVLAWQPDRLFLTHFAIGTDPAAHANQLLERLDDWSARVRQSLSSSGTDEERAARFARHVVREIRESVSEPVAAAFERGAAPALSWHGLARYWRTRPSGT